MAYRYKIGTDIPIKAYINLPSVSSIEVQVVRADGEVILDYTPMSQVEDGEYRYDFSTTGLELTTYDAVVKVDHGGKKDIDYRNFILVS